MIFKTGFSLLKNEQGVITIAPISDSPTYVNGELIVSERVLRHVSMRDRYCLLVVNRFLRCQPVLLPSACSCAYLLRSCSYVMRLVLQQAVAIFSERFLNARSDCLFFIEVHLVPRVE